MFAGGGAKIIVTPLPSAAAAAAVTRGASSAPRLQSAAPRSCDFRPISGAPYTDCEALAMLVGCGEHHCRPSACCVSVSLLSAAQSRPVRSGIYRRIRLGQRVDPELFSVDALSFAMTDLPGSP